LVRVISSRDVIQQPRLLALRLRGIEVRIFEALNKPWLLNSGVSTVIDAEDKVIAGGKELIRRAKVFIVETSMVSLYEKQSLFADILKLLEGLGFSYKGALSQAFSAHDGSILYADSIFIRGT